MYGEPFAEINWYRLKDENKPVQEDNVKLLHRLYLTTSDKAKRIKTPVPAHTNIKCAVRLQSKYNRVRVGVVNANGHKNLQENVIDKKEDNDLNLYPYPYEFKLKPDQEMQIAFEFSNPGQQAGTELVVILQAEDPLRKTMQELLQRVEKLESRLESHSAAPVPVHSAQRPLNPYLELRMGKSGGNSDLLPLSELSQTTIFK